ncbi:putative DsbA family dithiol-disulfide isomerase [Thermocatellispora tengchongensis]|uniref:Putative DsbA family dithiol-disulfide isomerase n=1 Tax=Thermocatellispora tengchongensis TaxID=1073253 RepID=A0A840P241_9ACTN|nr:putative DsbA family dithiol-disulfide isomerase [Thermocatellispora tengchongensis]
MHAPHADVHTAARVGPPAELQVDVYVDVYVDVLCPWCFIAKRRLAAAVAAMPDVRVSVVWRSFELGPTLGREPGPTAAEEMAGWWGDQADARIAMIRRLGAAEGLELNLDRARPVNSFDAHRLLHLAAASGRADRMLEGLLRAYHIDGADIADHAVLERLGVEAGVTAGDVAALLASDAYADAVRADEKRAAERGVTGVPALVIGTRPPVSAVQSPAHLVRLLKTV